jgi:hypothetical protein
VFLEVTPSVTTPDALFAGTPIDMAAAYFPPLSGVQFISDPAEVSWKKAEWGVWYAPGRPEAAFNTLEGITGNRAYLLHATRSLQWTVTGAVRFQRIFWQPNSFNFVGLPVDDGAPPTFAEFFAASRAHAGGRFYRLSAGKWRKVTDPGNERPRAGEAYWIYCAGRSGYQGPLDIRFSGFEKLDFNTDIGVTTVTVRNVGTDPAAINVEVDSAELPLKRVQLDRRTLARVFEPLPPVLSLGVLNTGTAVALKLQVQRDRMPENTGVGLLTFRSAAGVLLRLPVSAVRTK